MRKHIFLLAILILSQFLILQSIDAFAQSAPSATTSSPAAVASAAKETPATSADGNSVTLNSVIYTYDASNNQYRTVPDVSGNFKTFSVARDGSGYIIITYDKAGTPINTEKIAKVTTITSTGTGAPAAAGTVDQTLLADAEGSRDDTRHFLARSSAEGSELTSQETTILQNAARPVKPEPAYIDNNGRITNTKGAQEIPAPLVQSLLGQKDLHVKKDSTDWSFVSTSKPVSGIIFQNRVETERTITLSGSQWTDSTTTSTYSGRNLDKGEQGTLTNREGRTTTSRSVLVDAKNNRYAIARVSDSRTFYDENGNPTASVQTDYLNKNQALIRATDADVKDRIKKAPEHYTEQGEITIRNANGKIIAKRNNEGGFVDSEGHDLDKVIDHVTGKPLGWKAYLEKEGFSKEDIDKVGRESDNRALARGLKAGWFGSNIFYTLGTARSIGFWLRAYEQYRGLAQLTTLTWDKDWNREKLAREFCLGAGIENCAVSSICGEIHEITADNVLVGRGSAGELATSASLNAQRSKPILVANLSRQQLIDILGNASVIKGRRVDLTNPSFDPLTLGNLTVRLYHVEYSVTNNVEGDDDLNFNLEFRRSSPVTFEAPPRPEITTFEDLPADADFSQFVSSIPPSSYGEAVYSAQWFSANQILADNTRTHDHKYKYSTNEYDTACLTFDPGLPAGGALSGKLARLHCVPFREYAGGPQSIEQVQIPERRASTTSTQPAPLREGDNV